MGEINLRLPLQPFGPAGAFVLSDEQVAIVGQGPKAFPVLVTVNGQVLRLRLSRMGGANCIGIRRELREQASLELGSEYDVVVAKDGSVRTVEVPADLAGALAEAGLSDAFAALAPTHRREFATWVTEAKREQTRSDRIARSVEMVAGGRTRS